jgi:hypothetical protein
MSHIVSIATKVTDVNAVQAACQRLKLAPATTGEFTLFTQRRAGLGIQLPDWKYPVVVNTATGGVDYDNYNGSWGDQRHLDSFLQAYAAEKAKLEAAKNGYSVFEETLADGSIKLSVTVE